MFSGVMLATDVCKKIPFSHGENLIPMTKVLEWAESLGLEVAVCECSMQGRSEANEVFHLIKHFGAVVNVNEIRTQIYEHVKLNSMETFRALKGTYTREGFSRADTELREVVRGVSAPDYRTLFVMCQMGLMKLQIVHEKGSWFSFEQSEEEGSDPDVILAMRGRRKFVALKWKPESAEGKAVRFDPRMEMESELPVVESSVKDELWEHVDKPTTGEEEVRPDLVDVDQAEDEPLSGGVDSGEGQPGSAESQDGQPKGSGVARSVQIVDDLRTESEAGSETETDDEEILELRRRLVEARSAAECYKEKFVELTGELKVMAESAEQQSLLREGLMKESLGLKDKIRTLEKEKRQLERSVEEMSDEMDRMKEQREKFEQRLLEFCADTGIVSYIREQYRQEQAEEANKERERVAEEQAKLMARASRKGRKRGAGDTLSPASPKKVRPSPRTEKTETPYEEGEYECDYEDDEGNVCGKTFVTSSGLNKHKGRHCEKTIPCPEPGCDRMFRTEQDKKDHVGIHTDQFVCGKCGKRQTNRRALRAHQKGCK